MNRLKQLFKNLSIKCSCLSTCCSDDGNDENDKEEIKEMNELLEIMHKDISEYLKRVKERENNKE